VLGSLEEQVAEIEDKLNESVDANIEMQKKIAEYDRATVVAELTEGLTATEEEMLAALRFVWERFKIIIEPSCAVPVAPVLHRNLDLTGKRVGIIITGGNVDLDAYFDSLKAKFIEN
jgi:threonine dehydratase